LRLGSRGRRFTTPVTLDRVTAKRRSAVWRIGTPLAVLVCGGLFVVSAQSSEGTDLRPGRYDDLAALVDDEADRYRELTEAVAGLTAEVAELTDQVDDDAVQRIQAEVERLRDPAGLLERTGPGVQITLSDAPPEILEAAVGNRNLLVVHQQDIQAVVNALLVGGAEAVTIQGQRIISTTGIKCEGSFVLLQGAPYPQPYVIEAIGDPQRLAGAVAEDEYLQVYRAQSEDPEIAVGWDFELADGISAPAYDGLLPLSYARRLP
jgi:uncharacterized protein YlxW (UPF0749 family)